MGFPKDIPCDVIMESIADGVFTVDPDFTVTFFNHAAEQITGIPAQEALGRKCWEVFRSSICDGECALEACMGAGRTLSNRSIFILDTQGNKIPISISAAPLRDPSGRFIGGVETFRDLSEITLLRKEVSGNRTFEDIVGKSKALTKVFDILAPVAASDATILLLGESGTGKEIFAKTIHNLSPRKKGPFVAVNCGALPETLLESELFGYKAGAFTGARQDKPGRFQLAEKGTIFLDEIGDMAPSLQVKLLRVLQEKVYEPLGGVREQKADVRVIAATNLDLDELVAQGRFRQDLYYRLNVVKLVIPPLRQRPEDIPLLVDHFISRFDKLQGKQIRSVSEDVRAILMRYDYPGNVRELENIIEYAFILCNTDFIQVEHLPENLRTRLGQIPAGPDTPRTMEEAKCFTALRALERNQGKTMQTCRELAISKDTLRRILKRCEELGLK